ncbi:hypothetical protein [Prosthecomicrobium hirschii]|uniref:hypothetical protein n=1 Tax=Prosthecodimorpha hirschii TaxID=665126 RepID=UPI00221FC51D|nr:hypothetical protein [Prosthecomicrobium hirschii]MCW1843764.1 hypothetical protein [Prosthecomicrobium hirschii]
MGQNAQVKYDRQANSDLGLLLGGRNELLCLLDGIMDSPIIGYGSFARDSHYAGLRFIRLQQAGITTSQDIGSDRIPTHSFLFGAWIDARIVGAAFWASMIVVAGRGMV